MSQWILQGKDGMDNLKQEDLELVEAFFIFWEQEEMFSINFVAIIFVNHKNSSFNQT